VFNFGAEPKMSLINLLPRRVTFSVILGRGIAANTIDTMIREAMSEKKLLSFDYDGYHRIVEPHVYGMKNERNGMLVYQVRGQSSQGTLGYRRMYLGKIANMKVLDEKFLGQREIKDEHSKWDFIYYIVDK